MKTLQDMEKLWQIVDKFIADQQIYCEEDVFQSDRVIENGYELIADLCGVVGYLPYEDDFND